MNVLLKLDKRHSVPDFPSGSSINFRDGKLFVIGDDANNILVLDTEYNRIGSKKLFDFAEKRIPKPVKTDLETSTLIKLEGKDFLLVLGSASTSIREKVFIIPFSESDLDVPHFRVVHTDIFTSRLTASGVGEVNIEGSTVIGKHLLLSNRGNRGHVTNHLVVTEVDFWERQASVQLKVVPLKIPAVPDEPPSVSELCYVHEHDLLLMSLSSERTNNAYDDGAIGASYIGWIKNITQKIHGAILMVDEIINLSSVHRDFTNEKIEGLCVESTTGTEMVLHLVSDNDKGESKLFKLKMSVKAQ